MGNTVKIGNMSIGPGSPLALILGPCVIENNKTTYTIASFLKELTHKLDIPFIFRASYDKANRTSINSFRGPGLTDGMNILKRIKAKSDTKIISDAHNMVLKNAHMVTSAKGGNGAVREACEAILKPQGLWENILECFL
jgi:2-dehydro-3-deoxyphosphooctonate aldolase (KDO 8-P synthase)